MRPRPCMRQEIESQHARRDAEQCHGRDAKPKALADEKDRQHLARDSKIAKVDQYLKQACRLIGVLPFATVGACTARSPVTLP